MGWFTWNDTDNINLYFVQICTSDDACRFGRVSELFVYEKFSRVPAEVVEAGDICAVCGIEDIQVMVLVFLSLTWCLFSASYWFWQIMVQIYFTIPDWRDNCRQNHREAIAIHKGRRTYSENGFRNQHFTFRGPWGIWLSYNHPLIHEYV